MLIILVPPNDGTTNAQQRDRPSLFTSLSVAHKLSFGIRFTVSLNSIQLRTQLVVISGRTLSPTLTDRVLHSMLCLSSAMTTSLLNASDPKPVTRVVSDHRLTTVTTEG